VASLRAQLAEALQEVGETEEARLEADGALKAWVRGEFGVESTEANDFGFPAPKKPVMTVEQKALAVERGKATRKARGTLGKRQREAIRGTIAAPLARLVPAVVETPTGPASGGLALESGRGVEVPP
jgi:hypothetical protein